MIPELRELWKRILAGDSSAWQRLIESYSPLAFTVARRAGLNETDAEDCVQDVWLTLYKTKRALRDPQAIPAWIIKTTHRRAIVHVNRTRRTRSNSDSMHTNYPKLPDHEILQIEREFLIREALKRLDRRCQQLIEDLFFKKEQSSYKKLSSDIGISPNSLGPFRSRCLNKLANILREMGLTED